MLTVYYRKTPDALKCSALRMGVEGAQQGEYAGEGNWKVAGISVSLGQRRVL